MDLYEVSGTSEMYLKRKAEKEGIPLGGTIELTPLCNMHCKMCYIRQSKAEMDTQGKMLTCDQWLDIARQGCERGMLFLLLTGGEPLLYPEFKKLYAGLVKMGLILRINTNGTLIDEETADFFAEYGVRMLSITLYGKDDATYEKLCNNPTGFTKVMHAIHLLKERNVPFRLSCSITPDNVDQLRELYQIAENLEVPLNVATYMFPASVRRKNAADDNRLSPDQAAQATILSWKCQHKSEDILLPAKIQIASMKNKPRLKEMKSCFACSAGRSGFWMNWKGDITPCVMLDKPCINLLEHSFAECWNYIVSECRKLPRCKECLNCDKQNVCAPCPAMCYAETGRIDGRPKYLCEMTNALVQQLEAVIEESTDG